MPRRPAGAGDAIAESIGQGWKRFHDYLRSVMWVAGWISKNWSNGDSWAAGSGDRSDGLAGARVVSGLTVGVVSELEHVMNNTFDASRVHPVFMGELRRQDSNLRWRIRRASIEVHRKSRRVGRHSGPGFTTCAVCQDSRTFIGAAVRRSGVGLANMVSTPSRNRTRSAGSAEERLPGEERIEGAESCSPSHHVEKLNAVSLCGSGHPGAG